VKRLFVVILQAFIPQRVSGMTDIVANTLATFLGVTALQPRAIRVILELLGWLRARSRREPLEN